VLNFSGLIFMSLPTMPLRQAECFSGFFFYDVQAAKMDGMLDVFDTQRAGYNH
jgi:hypothetical protein